jgi:hypothetical protein
MWGGVWWGALTYGGTIFTLFGPYNPTTGLSACFNIALGYAGAWYGNAVYAGTPICPIAFGNIVVPPILSNLRDFCLIRC